MTRWLRSSLRAATALGCFRLGNILATRARWISRQTRVVAVSDGIQIASCSGELEGRKPPQQPVGRRRRCEVSVEATFEEEHLYWFQHCCSAKARPAGLRVDASAIDIVLCIQLVDRLSACSYDRCKDVRSAGADICCTECDQRSC